MSGGTHGSSGQQREYHGQVGVRIRVRRGARVGSRGFAHSEAGKPGGDSLPRSSSARSRPSSHHSSRGTHCAARTVATDSGYSMHLHADDCHQGCYSRKSRGAVDVRAAFGFDARPASHRGSRLRHNLNTCKPSPHGYCRLMNGDQHTESPQADEVCWILRPCWSWT